MRYHLFRILENNSEEHEKKTIQIYDGEDLREMANVLKEQFKSNNETAQFLEPDLKTKSEIVCISSHDKDNNTTLTTTYHVHASKANKTAPWGELNADEYTDFILDMKKWLKNNIKSEDNKFAQTFGRKTITTESGYTIP